MNLEDMTIEDLVIYINSELDKNRTMKDIEKNDFKVNERVISKRLIRRGYKKINNRYELIDNNRITRKNNNESCNNKVDDIGIYLSKIDINALTELINLREDIKKVIQEYNRSKDIINIEPVELKPKAVTEVKQKLFKVDTNVLDHWERFIKKHKEFKVQSLISLALEEFLNKYDK